MINRTIHNQILQSLKIFPITVITGPRQVGKSTEVYKLTKSHGFKYVSLDNIDNRRLAINDPKYFLEIHQQPLIIDEIQYAPILMEVIEEIVNKARIEQKNPYGMYVLTGSQTFQLMQNVTQSMAGRANILKMEPLSLNEISNKAEIPFIPSEDMLKTKIDDYSIESLFNQIINGFYPELYSNDNLNADLFYDRYISTYIDRDISEIINVSNKTKFHNFMQILASLTGQQLKVDNISKTVGVDNKTINKWISVLETSGIIYLLQPYNEQSITKRIAKSTKIYFADTGLAAYLIRVGDYRTLEASVFSGAFMETYVMNEIRKSYINNGKAFNAYYYRDSNQNEIDLILLENGTLHFIEIKKGISFNESDVKAFKQLEMSNYNKGYSCIICNTRQNYAIKKNVAALSIKTI